MCPCMLLACPGLDTQPAALVADHPLITTASCRRRNVTAERRAKSQAAKKKLGLKQVCCRSPCRFT